jgi:hypothetical protein
MRSFMGAPTGALGYMWSLLLQSAAGNSKITDEELFRYIKDATGTVLTDLNSTLFRLSWPCAKLSAYLQCLLHC